MKKIYSVVVSTTSKLVGFGLPSRDSDGEIMESHPIITYYNWVRVYEVKIEELPTNQMVSLHHWLCGDKNNLARANPLLIDRGSIEYSSSDDLFSSNKKEFLIDMEEETYSSCTQMDTNTMCLSGELESDTDRDILSDEAFDKIIETIKELTTI